MLILINENQLDEWVRANAKMAQGIIVELVWRLVAASCPNPRERRFPLGDSIDQHGPDGVLDTDLGYEPFVPEGRSFWEIGTSIRVREKATDDYNSLTEAIPEHIRLDTTFVFVSPISSRRGWEYTWREDAQARWIEERRQKGEWKDIRVIDGTKLIDWLHHFPAVELWLAQKIHSLPSNQIETLEHRWKILKSIGEPPPLIPDVFLANRDEACQKLGEIFDGTLTRLKLTTHFPDQVVDFIAAYVASLDEESRIDVVSRCLIISGIEAWNALCNYHRHKLILIAEHSLDLNSEDGTRLIQKAQRAGHAIVFGGPQGGIPDPASVLLRRPREHQIQEALIKAGYPEERARTLAQKSGGNLGTLLRCLQNLSVLPEWAQRSEAAELAVAMLLGGWRDTSEADQKVVEDLTGNPFGEWIVKMREIALLPSTPLVYQEGNWKFVLRYEGWYALGPRLFDEHLDRLKTIAISVLKEPDPQFELHPEKRYMASIYGKVLKHSRLLRKGIAESLALLGSHPQALRSCSQGKAEATAVLVVREILSDADWVRWASLNDLLPLLAEAAPEAFLDAVEEALQKDQCPFDELFVQETGGVTGHSYISGLLWALETLAWDPDYFSRVVLCLGELAKRDPGGSLANRPINSLITILLPWFPQTCAPISKRVAAVKALLAELPDICWRLLINLFPNQQLVSTGTRKPAWRETIPDKWRQRVTNHEYWEQVSAYVKLAINEAKKDVETKKDVSKLTEIIDNLDTLPPFARGQILEYLSTETVLTLPEDKRSYLWSKLVDIITKHKRFTDAKWAMPPEQIEKVTVVAERLKPESPLLRYQRLFSERDFDLFEEKGNYEKQIKALDLRRQRAVEEIAADGGVAAVIEFARTVQSPWRVGIAFGAIARPEVDTEILPGLLDSGEKPITQFIGGFIRSRLQNRGWSWVDGLKISDWRPEQIGKLLSFLPFSQETWERAARLLGENQSAYWKQANVNPYEADQGLEFAVKMLIQHGRPIAAISCLFKILSDKQPFDPQLAILALLRAITSPESLHVVAYEVVEIIKALQNNPDITPEGLFHVEWAYLPLLKDHGAEPKLLSRKLADDPHFFCEVIRLVFLGKNEECSTEKPTEEKKKIAENAFRLLQIWRIPPGLQKDGSYDGNKLKEWLDAVKRECSKTGHLEIAMYKIGQVLIHVPPDPDGLWIHRAAAEVLNGKDAKAMRDGFKDALYSSRGVYVVDPTGKSEKELAAKYRKQAEAVDQAGYPRLAATLRELAETYEREAERISTRESFNESW